MDFKYLLERIKEAPFTKEPFKHVYIENFFKPEHFEALTKAQEIKIDGIKDDYELFEKLEGNGYEIIQFPGTTTDKDTYLKWHQSREKNSMTNSACESFGVVLRLMKPQSAIITELKDFLNSKEFQQCLGEKYGLEFESYEYDAGIQKYLDGYEISPHPDIRRKALTYMVNINPHQNSEKTEIHTHYMKFTPQMDYVRNYWEANQTVERAWVPWDWCETAKQQTVNNSMVIFAPDSDTLHAVKANYNHFDFQRTQLYGNFWFHESTTKTFCPWENLVIKTETPDAPASKADALKKVLPDPIVEKLRNVKNKIGL